MLLPSKVRNTPQSSDYFMHLLKFTDYETYVKAQTATNKEKLHKVWAQEQEIDQIASYIETHIPNPTFGICHGVRNGWEVEKFKELLGVDVIGTEISDTAAQFPGVIQWDFHKVKDEWINNVDFIYSNALDHSYDPQFCLDQWMRCLKPTGRCFIQWTVFHGEGDIDGADCFGASFDEYRALISAKYEIEASLSVMIQRPWTLKRVFKKLRRHGLSGLRRVKQREIFVFVVKPRNVEERSIF
jgi:hypothetical protein